MMRIALFAKVTEKAFTAFFGNAGKLIAWKDFFLPTVLQISI